VFFNSSLYTTPWRVVYLYALPCLLPHTPQLPAAPKRIKTRVARREACESFMWGQCESSGKYFVCFENGTEIGLSECVRRKETEASCILQPIPWGTVLRERYSHSESEGTTHCLHGTAFIMSLDPDLHAGESCPHPLCPISSTYILILFSHLCLRLPSGIFSIDVQIKFF
jgi:hypothetical protein